MATSPSSSSSSNCVSLSTPSLSPPPLSTEHSAEPADAYPSGGYYPARIGEWLHNGQYQIIRPRYFAIASLARALS